MTSADLQAHYGVDPRTVTNWINEDPPCPHVMENKRRKFDSVAVARWHAERAVRKSEGDAAVIDLRQEQARKTRAEADQAELDLAKMRGELVDVSEFRSTLRQIATTLRSQLVAVAGRYAPRTVGLKTLPESQQVWDGAVRDILAELQEG